MLAIAFCVGLCACGDDNSSSAPEESSSSEAESSSSEPVYETRCSVPPVLNLVWPLNDSYIADLDFDFTASVNTISCDKEVEVDSATLYYDEAAKSKYKMIGATESYKKVGSVKVKMVQDTANSRKWHLSYNLTELDKKSKLVDGYYKVVLELYGKSYDVVFLLIRRFDDLVWDFDMTEEHKNVEILCEGCRFEEHIYKMIMTDSKGDTVRQFYKPDRFTPLLSYSMDSLWNVLPEGRYSLRFMAVSGIVAPDTSMYLKLLRNDTEDSTTDQKLAWAFDENLNVRKGLLGAVSDTSFVIGRNAPAIANMPKDYAASIYRVSDKYMTQFKVSFDMLQPVYGTERYAKLYLEAAEYNSDEYKTIYSDSVILKSDTTNYLLNVLDTTLKDFDWGDTDYYQIRMRVEDEYQNVNIVELTKLYIGKDSVSDYTLSEFFVPAKIPSKLYDCTKYKCQDVSLLNPDVEYGELLDERDNRVYRTLKLGDQVWMAQNLNYAADSSYCFDNDSANCDIYGRLYPWHVAVGKTLEECPQDSSACDLSADYIDNKNHVRGICPAGYHMPTDSDYVELERYFAEKYSAEVDGNLIYVAKYLLSPYKWDNMEERGLRKAKRDFTNESGFTVLPSGGAVRDDTGSWIFSVQSWGARYWTSSRNSNYMSCWEGSGIDDYVLLWICDLYGMFSLRCVK
jgi:uncharacterized protein (TIGR02145 family)